MRMESRGLLCLFLQSYWVRAWTWRGYWNRVGSIAVESTGSAGYKYSYQRNMDSLMNCFVKNWVLVRGTNVF